MTLGLTVQSLVQLLFISMFLAPMAAYVHTCTCALSSLAGDLCSSARRGQNLNQEHDSRTMAADGAQSQALSETVGSRLFVSASLSVSQFPHL